MDLNRSKLLVINISISVLVFVLLFTFWSKISHQLFTFLIFINRPLTSLTINPLDLIILSFIPIWTYPLYSKVKVLSTKYIILINLVALLILMLTCVIAFVLIAIFVKSNSPFVYYNAVIMPFDFFPTVVLITGVLMTYLLFYLFGFKKNKNS